MPDATARTTIDPTMLVVTRETKPSLRCVDNWMRKVASTHEAKTIGIQVKTAWAGDSAATSNAPIIDSTQTGITLVHCQVTSPC